MNFIPEVSGEAQKEIDITSDLNVNMSQAASPQENSTSQVVIVLFFYQYLTVGVHNHIATERLHALINCNNQKKNFFKLEFYT